MRKGLGITISLEQTLCGQFRGGDPKTNIAYVKQDVLYRGINISLFGNYGTPDASYCRVRLDWTKHSNEGKKRTLGFSVLHNFLGGIAVIEILHCGIAVCLAQF